MSRDEKRLLTPDEVADRLRIKVGTLAVWRSNRRYDLPWTYSGRLVRYEAIEVDAFVARGTVRGR